MSTNELQQLLNLVKRFEDEYVQRKALKNVGLPLVTEMFKNHLTWEIRAIEGEKQETKIST